MIERLVIPAGLSDCLCDVVNVEGDRVNLADAGGKSITNAANYVTIEVFSRYPGKRIFYTDTGGVYDELMHVLGDFVGFAPGDR